MRTHSFKSSGSRRAGFTLLEVMIVVGLMALLILATQTLFTLACRAALHTSAQTTSSLDAGIALQHVQENIRTADWFALPDDTTSFFVAPTGTSYTASQFETTDAGYSVDTGIMIVNPSYVTGLTVYGATSNVLAPLPYDRDVTGSYLWIYRSDAGGAPDATAGTYLWEVGTEEGSTVNRAIIKDVDANSANAVQFIRPSTALTTSALPYQVDIKIVAGAYDLQSANMATGQAGSGESTSESSNGGNVTLLVGNSVLMRNHELSSAHEPTPYTPTTTSGNRWTGN